MLSRKVTNRIKQLYCDIASHRQNHVINSSARLVMTTFYDVEGDYAIENMSVPCFRALEKNAELEESLGIRSTYNVVAKLANEAPSLFRDLENAGHEIASHSYRHHVLTSMNASACRDDIFKTRKVFDTIGLNVTGHRSPQSMWNLNVLRALYDAGFTWNAENSRNDMPFSLPVSLLSKKKTLWRIPVSIDDWSYEGSGSSPEQVLESWKHFTNKKLISGGYMAIGFHPWIEEPVERFEVLKEYMKWISSHPEIRTMPFCEVVNNIT